jgi:hypothetical protein
MPQRISFAPPWPHLRLGATFRPTRFVGLAGVRHSGFSIWAYVLTPVPQIAALYGSAAVKGPASLGARPL